jgi:ABC-type Fe3+-hydroxamate transport system substrate-binding protein
LSNRRAPALTDARGRALALESAPRRIVSIVPSITDALFAFGLGDRVAGVTKFCLEPAAAVAGKPKVGGTKDPDIARIRELRADLVIANIEENRAEDIEALERAGVPVFVTYPRSVAEGIEMMRQLAAITNAEAAARPFIQAAETELASAHDSAATRVTLRTFCPIWRTPWMTIGPDTYIHDFLAVCGAQNVFGDSRERYPVTDLDEVARLRPEVILLPDEPYRFQRRHLPALRAMTEVPAVRENRIYLVEGKLLCWYGPRIADSLRRVRALLWE